MNHETGVRLSRRRFLGLTAGMLVSIGCPKRASAAVRKLRWGDSPNVIFDVVRADTVIGVHEVRIGASRSDLIVRTRIDIEVGLLAVKLFDYHHTSTETWGEGRLMVFESETDEDGDHQAVSGRARADGFEVHGDKGTLLAPADIMVGSYWTSEILSQDQLLDPQKGRLKKQVIRRQQRAAMEIGGRPRAVTRYWLESVIDGKVVYDDNGGWVGATFNKKGSDIVYRLRA